jgi:hypothetical protein
MGSRLTLAAALILVLAPVLFAQPPGPGVAPGGRFGDQRLPPRDPRQAEAPRGTAIMRGTVVAADNGSPIRRAQVRLSGQGVPARIATTDERGRFEIKELPAGRYTVSASKGGFVPLQYGQRRPSEQGTPLDLGDGQVLEKIVIGLPRGSVITGRITDEFGEPVANAVVSAMRYGYQAGARRLIPGAGQNSRDTTDDQGHYRLFGLSPGEYIISASLRANQEVTDPAGEPTGYAATYYPGTPNVNEAQRVNVAIGQEAGNVAFALIATRLVRVSGAAINSQGQAVTGGVVMLMPANARVGGGMLAQVATARIDGSGQFRLTNVAPGRYTAQVRAGMGFGPRGGQGGDAEFGRLDVTVGTDDVDGVVIVTGPGARVQGVVTTDTGAPPSIRAQQVQIGSRLATPDQGMQGGGGMARLNDDWTFELGGLFDARLFRVGLPQGWTLKSVFLNGQDITDTPIDLPPGQLVSGLQIVISERPTALSGRVTDTKGTPVTDVTVVVLPADESLWTYQSRFIRTARPDQDGRFEIQGLPPYERYRAVPVQALEDGQAGDPEFLARIREQGTTFSLNEGETRALDLRFAAK